MIEEIRRRTIVPILCVAIVGHEQVVTTGEGVGFAAVLEEGAQGALHRGLSTGNREAVDNGDVVDEGLERIVGLGRGVESRSGAKVGASDGLAERDINPLGEVETVEVGTNVSGQLESTSTVERLGQGPNPDGGVGVDPLSVLGGGLGGFAHGESGKDGVDILLLLLSLLPRVLPILSFVFGLELAIRQLLEPCKHDKVDGRDLDAFSDEERLNL